MKTQNKVRILILSIVCILLIVFLGYEYMSSRGEKLYLKSKQASDKQVIDKVLEFKAESFLTPTKENSAWDDMLAFTKNKNIKWAKENLIAIQKPFGMSSLSVYDIQGNSLIAIADSGKSNLILTNAQIKQLFTKAKTCHFFLKIHGELCEIFGATIVPTIDVFRNNEASGFLISSKEWDKDYVSELQKATGFNLKILTLSDMADSANMNQEEVLFKNLKDLNNENVAILKFSKQNYLAADLGNMDVILIICINVLMIMIGFLFFLTKKWITFPLKRINESLSSGKSEPIKISQQT